MGRTEGSRAGKLGGCRYAIVRPLSAMGAMVTAVHKRRVVTQVVEYIWFYQKIEDVPRETVSASSPLCSESY
ncbi:hypothetical protein HHA02_06680 [Cobetia marina]|nr:hypothetical protein HHA02_06680 [Cobetia marina]